MALVYHRRRGFARGEGSNLAKRWSSLTGALLFAKGRYTVTLDLTTGEQTYTREALEN